MDRLEHSGRIPAIRLITNRSDPSRGDHEAFFEWVGRSTLPRTGPFELILTDAVDGHSVLDPAAVQNLLIP